MLRLERLHECAAGLLLWLEAVLLPRGTSTSLAALHEACAGMWRGGGRVERCEGATGEGESARGSQEVGCKSASKRKGLDTIVARSRRNARELTKNKTRTRTRTPVPFHVGAAEAGAGGARSSCDCTPPASLRRQTTGSNVRRMSDPASLPLPQDKSHSQSTRLKHTQATGWACLSSGSCIQPPWPSYLFMPAEHYAQFPPVACRPPPASRTHPSPTPPKTHRPCKAEPIKESAINNQQSKLRLSHFLLLPLLLPPARSLFEFLGVEWSWPGQTGSNNTSP